MEIRQGSLVASLVVALVVSVTHPLPATAAGNVTASVNGSGVLVIKGDTADNGIHIVPAGAGAYEISASDANTTINGQPVAFVASGVTGDVKISMGDGNDTVIIEDTNVAPFPDDLTIRTGAGNDSVEINDGGVTDDTTISTDQGDDTVTDQASTHGGNLKVRT